MKSGSRISAGVAVALCLSAACWMSGGVQAEELATAAGADPSKITLQFQGMEITEVLKLLAEESGLNVVLGRNVSGQVTLFVKDVDPWETLEVILAANELAYERRGDILTVITQREFELLHGQPYQDRRVLKSLALRYARVEQMAQSLNQVKSTIGRVIADEASNTVILFDVPPLIEQMTTLINELDQPIETRIFSLNYGTVKALTPVLQEAVTAGVGKISVDERTNQIAITDYPAKLAELARMIQAFDERSTEVLIEAKIVQVTLSDKFQLGIDWQAVGRDSLKLKGLTSLSLTSGVSLTVASALNPESNRVGDYKVVLEALRTYGDTKIISEPRLTVVNNQEAKILVGTKEPYITKSTSQTGTGTAVTAESVNFIDVGVKLFVTPTITRDRFVQMKIRPEVSSKTGTLTTSEKNEIPIVETSEAETLLLVQDGATVIMGGLIKNEKTQDEQRIPILGDLPIIGMPFRSTKDTTKRTELVVLLTPRIVTGTLEEVRDFHGRPVSELDGATYYVLILEQLQAVASAQRTYANAKGIVVMEFLITPEGRLKGEPRVVSSEATVLNALAKQAVQTAAPFPPLPSDAGKEPKAFKVPIAYQ